MMNSSDEVTRRRRAALGTAAFMLAGPGTVVGVVPWRLTRWRRRPVPGGRVTRAVGAALTGAGGAVLVQAFVRFAVEGIGTPAPLAPTRHLVVGGIYRHVRNPMYVAIESAILGQALLFGQPRLLAYACVAMVPPALFVRLYEEPTLVKTYGEEYERYRRNVPRWIPRLRPWDRT